jgi:hypothetical protein
MSTIVELPSQIWPALIIALGSALGVLRVFGFLNKPADAGELKVVQTKLEVLEGFHHENRGEHGVIREKNEREHHEIRVDISKVAESLARIEGRLEKR